MATHLDLGRAGEARGDHRAAAGEIGHRHIGVVAVERQREQPRRRRRDAGGGEQIVDRDAFPLRVELGPLRPVGFQRQKEPGRKLDSDAGIANRAEQIAMEAGFSTAMPPGNVSEITPAERALLVQWYTEGRS